MFWGNFLVAVKKLSPEMSWCCLECIAQAAFFNKHPFDLE